MNIPTLGDQFTQAVAQTAIGVPISTPLHRVASDLFGMVEAYLADGHDFLRKGDLVNAHAAFTYGWGWLDAGCVLGYFTGEEPLQHLPMIDEMMPFFLKSHLEEKTHRYCIMLVDALAGVVLAPDEGSELHGVAREVHGRVQSHLDRGKAQLGQGSYLNALGGFSYGYGWLDAGVRAGLFSISGDRGLFTV